MGMVLVTRGEPTPLYPVSFGVGGSFRGDTLQNGFSYSHRAIPSLIALLIAWWTSIHVFFSLSLASM